VPASNGFPGVGAVGASHVSPPVQVAIVAGTKTRLRVLVKLLAQPGVLVCGTAQDATSAEALVVSAAPNAVLLDLDLWSGGLEAIERIMATRATSIVVIGSAAKHPEAAIAAGAVDVVGALDVAPGSPEYANIVMRHLKIASRVRVITHPRGRLRGRGIRGPAAAQPQLPAAVRGGARVKTIPLPAVADGVSISQESIERRLQQHSGDWSNSAKNGPLIVAVGASTGGPPPLPPSCPNCRLTWMRQCWWCNTWRRVSSKDSPDGLMASVPCPSLFRWTANGYNPVRCISLQQTRTCC